MAVWVTQRGKKYYLYVEHQGRRIVKSIGTDEQEANQIATSVRAAILCGTYAPDNINTPSRNKSVLLKEYADKWFTIHSPVDVEGNLIVPIRADDRIHWRPSTTTFYRGILQIYLLPVFGDRPMLEITKAEIKDYFVRLSKQGNLTPTRIGSIFSTLRAIFNEAIEDDIVSRSPVKGIAKYIDKRNNRKLESDKFFTRAEMIRILQTAQECFPYYYPFLLCAARTGMRLGELIALRWDNIDFEQNSIEVKQSYYRGLITPTKSQKPRTIDMSPQLKKTLILWRAEQQRVLQSLGKENIKNIVFCTINGNYVQSSHFRENIWNQLLKKADVRRLNPHALRHTFISLLLQQGESPVYVQQQCGHHSIELTVGVYGHLIPGANRRAVEKLDDDFYCTNTAQTLTVVK